MRIYQQIPIPGTEGAKTSVRALQATTADPYPEFKTLRALKKLGCDVVPDLDMARGNRSLTISSLGVISHM